MYLSSPSTIGRTHHKEIVLRLEAVTLEIGVIFRPGANSGDQSQLSRRSLICFHLVGGRVAIFDQHFHFNVNDFETLGKEILKNEQQRNEIQPYILEALNR